MRTPPQDVWPAVRAERLRLAADLRDLDPARWTTSSLCPGWTVHDVLAHLVDTARTGRLTFLTDMVVSRLNFDRANERGIAREKRVDPQDTVEALAQSADLRRTPPADLATRLVEAIIHGEDIRRPLGMTGTYPDHTIERALAYQLRTPVSFGGGRERAAGLRLVDRASGTAWGTGDTVEAAPLDLLLAVSGRPVARERLRGPGLVTLRRRIEADGSREPR